MLERNFVCVVILLGIFGTEDSYLLFHLLIQILAQSTTTTHELMFYQECKNPILASGYLESNWSMWIGEVIAAQFFF